MPRDKRPAPPEAARKARQFVRGIGRSPPKEYHLDFGAFNIRICNPAGHVIGWTPAKSREDEVLATELVRLANKGATVERAE